MHAKHNCGSKKYDGQLNHQCLFFLSYCKKGCPSGGILKFTMKMLVRQVRFFKRHSLWRLVFRLLGRFTFCVNDFFNQSTHLISLETPPRVQRFKRCTFNSFIVLTNTKTDFPAPKAPENFGVFLQFFSFLQFLRASEVGPARFSDGNSTSNCGRPKGGYSPLIGNTSLALDCERR